MTNEKLNELKAEADALGIKYGANIKAETLQNKIDLKKGIGIEEVEEDEDVVDTSEDSDEIIGEKIVEKVVVKKTVIKEADAKAEALDNIRRNLKRIQREEAKTKIVKLTMVDKREVSYATSAYFSDGALAMRVPLDTWVEMPIALIAIAEKQRAILSVESDRGAVTKEVAKYVVEYKK